jgi:sulfide dehydrogenase cytochrome subunit
MKSFYCVALSLALGMFASICAADDLASIIENCNGCHGDDGVSQWTEVPTIAGIDAFSHADALFFFRDDERPCAESKYRQGDTSRPPTTMCEVTADLSDEDIEALGDSYAELPFVAAVQEFDAALAASGAAIHKEACDRCHSEGGSNVEDEAGILSGQWMGYMENAFADYASGEREQDKKMKETMEELSADDVKALIHYYASQQ